jgi:hypothetical protein
MGPESEVCSSLIESIWCQPHSREGKITYLLKGSISELEDIDDTDQSTIVLDDGKIEVMTIYHQLTVTNVYSLCIFLRASWTVVVGAAVSGWGVMTLTTLHLWASSPAAITLKTTSLEVKIPAIRGIPFPAPADPLIWEEVVLVSMTQTAVVRRSFINRAASRTLVRGVTVGGAIWRSMTEVKSGWAIFSLSAST